MQNKMLDIFKHKGHKGYDVVDSDNHLSSAINETKFDWEPIFGKDFVTKDDTVISTNELLHKKTWIALYFTDFSSKEFTVSLLFSWFLCFSSFFSIDVQSSVH
jgi:hypothetical protein